LIMIFRPKGLLGTREFSFVHTWDSVTRFVKVQLAKRSRAV
jgi:hypothetical protein